MERFESYHLAKSALNYREKKNMVKSKFAARELVLCSMFVALIAVGAFIKIPIPVVPFTLQFMFTMLAGLLLGGRLGAISVLGYIILGLAGMPIFTEGGGISYLLKPSFGYIIGFCIASYVAGKIANQVEMPSLKRLLTANFTGLVIVYTMGMLYYYIICNFVINTPIGLIPLFVYCFMLAVPGDIFLCIFSAYLARRIIPVRKRIFD